MVQIEPSAKVTPVIKQASNTQRECSNKQVSPASGQRAYRMVLRKPRFAHGSPLLQELHWLLIFVSGPNSKGWLSPSKPYLLWVQVI